MEEVEAVREPVPYRTVVLLWWWGGKNGSPFVEGEIVQDIGAACGAPVFYGEDRRRSLEKASLGVGRALGDRSVATECGGPREICRLRGRLWRRQSAQERTVHGVSVQLSTFFGPCPATEVVVVSQLVMHDPSSCRKFLGWMMGEL
jgi:hypothetical protein